MPLPTVRRPTNPITILSSSPKSLAQREARSSWLAAGPKPSYVDAVAASVADNVDRVT